MGKASITAWQIDCELPGDNTPLPKEQVGWGVGDTMGFGIAALGRERGKALAGIIIQLLPDVWERQHLSVPPFSQAELKLSTQD